jgi:hypothetical protein
LLKRTPVRKRSRTGVNARPSKAQDAISRSAVASLEAAWLKVLKELHPEWAWTYLDDDEEEAALNV